MFKSRHTYLVRTPGCLLCPHARLSFGKLHRSDNPIHAARSSSEQLKSEGSWCVGLVRCWEVVELRGTKAAVVRARARRNQATASSVLLGSLVACGDAGEGAVCVTMCR
jgi:hypothetical protein